MSQEAKIHAWELSLPTTSEELYDFLTEEEGLKQLGKSLNSLISNKGANAYDKYVKQSKELLLSMSNKKLHNITKIRTITSYCNPTISLFLIQMVSFAKDILRKRRIKTETNNNSKIVNGILNPN